MHTYLFYSPIPHTIPILLPETLQELRRMGLPLKGPQGRFQCLSSHDKQKPEEVPALVQNKSYAFLFFLHAKNVRGFHAFVPETDQLG